jgi:parvulin-like peptidyl-prolyl isomerase
MIRYERRTVTVTEQRKKGTKVGVIAIVSTLIIGSVAAAGSFIWAGQSAFAAKVNGQVISTEEFATYVERAKKQYAGQIGMDFNSAAGQTMLVNLKKNIMNSLVEMSLMKQEAKNMNLSVTEDEFKSKFDELLKARYKGDRKAFDEDLTRNKYTYEEFETQFKQQILLSKLYQKIIEKVKIADADLKKYYDEHMDMYKEPDKIKAQHILIKAEEGKKDQETKARAKAEGLIAQLKGGADFGTLAKANSDDTSNKDNGGDLGAFNKGMMVTEFEDAAWKLKEGEITQTPVKTRFGFHIIKRGASVPASTKGFADVKESIRAQLDRERKQKAFEDWLKQLKDKSKIEINEKMTAAPPAPPATEGKPGEAAKPGEATAGQPGEEAPAGQNEVKVETPAGDGHDH